MGEPPVDDTTLCRNCAGTGVVRVDIPGELDSEITRMAKELHFYRKVTMAAVALDAAWKQNNLDLACMCRAELREAVQNMQAKGIM